MCKNARSRCSVFVAMDKTGQTNEAIKAYVALVNSTIKRKDK